MNLQIFGTKKCSNTKKAERFFKERRIPFHSIRLEEKGISKGELESVLRSIPPEDLIDPDSKEYEKQNLKYMKFSIPEKLLESPLLLKTPIIRNGKEATAGYSPDIWEKWLKDS